MKDSLGNRMKRYELANKYHLTRRLPAVIRIDGKSFHTVTRKFKKPYDDNFRSCMMQAAIFVCKNIQGIKFAYGQSDEISFLVTDYESIYTQAPFDYEVVKLVSVSAALGTQGFINGLLSIRYQNLLTDKEKLFNEKPNSFDNRQMLINVLDELKNPHVFDSRIFNVPTHDVCNYFIWRQKDAKGKFL